MMTYIGPMNAIVRTGTATENPKTGGTGTLSESAVVDAIKLALMPSTTNEDNKRKPGGYKQSVRNL
jgi:hypothetical protein